MEPWTNIMLFWYTEKFVNAWTASRPWFIKADATMSEPADVNFSDSRMVNSCWSFPKATSAHGHCHWHITQNLCCYWSVHLRLGFWNWMCCHRYLLFPTAQSPKIMNEKGPKMWSTNPRMNWTGSGFIPWKGVCLLLWCFTRSFFVG